MGYPTSLITNNTPGVDIYPPQAGQAFGSFTGQPTGTANPDTPTWFARVSSELVAIEKALGIPALTTNGYVQEAPQDGNMYVRQNGLWVPRPTTNVQVFTTPGSWLTWTKPAGAVWVKAIVIGGGSGGGSGRRSASGTAAAGGNGGNSGQWSFWEGPASALPATVYLYVGAGGIGGAAVTAADTNGNNGNGGGYSCFGSTNQTSGTTVCYCQGGYVAAGGTTANGNPSGYGQGALPGGLGSAGSITAAPSTPSFPGATSVYGYLGVGPGGGGAGGGISTGAVAFAGATGGPCASAIQINGAYQGVAGTAGGGNGGAPTDNNAAAYSGGYGGGGGGASVSAGVNAGNGGNGSSFGGAGGGGGAALDTAGNSGAGGNGAPGLVLVAVFF